ncbi:hypothetical protein [Glaciimonas soli]|uniref:hypothetical protein n=1 Tax=Glaciimonas soli TaxID=2590999 RepID=UPI001293BFBA|nr:hypothetical protein [Glaciimonas soli]
MSVPTQSAPLLISDNAENEMALTADELIAWHRNYDEPAKNALPCQQFITE